MKQLNDFINEKLVLNKQTIYYNDNTCKKILEEIRITLGFDKDKYNEYPYIIIKEWITNNQIYQIEMAVDNETYNEFLLEPNKKIDMINVTILDENKIKELFIKNSVTEYFNDHGIYIYTNDKQTCLVLAFNRSNTTYTVLMYNRKLTSKY